VLPWYRIWELPMANYYTVKQGDHLSGIAKSFGLPRDKIWNDSNNAALRAKRVNPNVLFPGDQLYIPDLAASEYARPTDVMHKFKVNSQRVKLCLVLEDIYEKPISGAPCLLRLGSKSVEVTTDGTGRLQQDIPADLRNASLTILAPQTPFEGTMIPMKIGDLDPVDQTTGQQARLNNLGYFAGEVGGTDVEALESAVEEFQCDQNLTVDGICGPQTQTKLKQVHGC
jgi:Putative peptidoglycan binding domain/LysM domain